MLYINKHIKRIIILLAVTLLSQNDGLAQNAETAPVNYVVILPKDSVPSLCDSMFYAKAFAVHFQLNKFTLLKKNILSELKHEVLPWAKKNDLVLSYVDLRGASSPDGPRSWNETLAQRRSLALYDEIDSLFRHGHSHAKIVTKHEAEAYEHLCYLMRKSADPDAERVSAIVDKYNHDAPTLKRELLSMDGGKLWRRLINEYYHELRAARVLLYFNASADIKEEVAQPDTAIVVEQPEVAATEVMPETIFEPRREVLAIKTNLLEWGAWVPQYGMCPMPNIAIEYYPTKGHFTFGGSIDFPWWMNGKETHKYFALRNLQLEARYYMRNSKQSYIKGGAAFKGLYFSAYAHGFMYQIGFNEKKGWIGEGGGGGVGIGYVLQLSRNGHWRVDFNLQVGAFLTKYDPYVYGCPVENIKDGYYYYDYTGKAEDFKRREYSLTWVGPTRIGISLSYDLFYRPNHRKGLSLRNKEKGGKQ